MEIPVACTLSAGEVVDRTAEWRHFFGASVESAHMEQGHLRLQLKQSPEVLAIAVDLARREIECCAFFDFSIVMRSGASCLIMGVPPGAEAILDDFARLLPADLTGLSAKQADERLTDCGTKSDL